MDSADAEDLVATLTENYERTLTQTEVKQVAETCHYHPLALHVASAYLGTFTHHAVANYIEQVRTAPMSALVAPEYANLAQILGISIEQLHQTDPILCERWHLLALMPDAFDAELAGALLGELIEDEEPDVEPLDKTTTKAMLDVLVRLNLLETIPSPTENDAVRYRLHDFLTDYALHHSPHCPAQAAQDEAVRCHALTALQQGSNLDDLYLEGKPIEALMQFDELWNHLNSAWQRLQQANDDVANFVVEHFAGWMINLLHLRISPRAQINYQEAALRIIRSSNEHSPKAIILGNLGVAYSNLGEVRTAIGYYEQALAIDRNIGDRRGEGINLGNLGVAFLHLGEVRTAIDYFKQALAIDREIGYKRGEETDLGNLGMAYSKLGEVRTAIDYYEQALVLARKISDKRGESHLLGNLGIAYVALGDIPTAIGYHENALQISREIGDKRAEGQDLGNLGNAYADLGKVPTAINYYEQALALFHDINDKRSQGIVNWLLAIAYNLEGEREKAIMFARAALALYEATEHPSREKVRAQLREWGVEDV